MTPHTGAWLASDTSLVFRERALLVSPRHLRQRRDEPLALAHGFDRLLTPMAVTVVAHEGDRARIVAESRDVQLLFWATDEAFEPVPVRPQRLALGPGQYPQGPAGMPGRDEVGVWVKPGRYDPPLERRGGWRLVSVEDRVIRAKGWLDESLFGVYFVPLSLDSPRTRRGGVWSGSRLLAAPGGPAVMTLPYEPPPGYQVRWFEEVGPAVPGFVHVRHVAGEAWVQGLVRASDFDTGPGGSVGWGSRAILRRTPPMPPARLALEASVLLHDGPGGEPVGRTLRRMEIPDRLDPAIDRGRRRVEVPFGEVGLVPAWVEATAVAPLPAASASASAR